MKYLNMLKYYLWFLVFFQDVLRSEGIFWNMMDIRYWRCVIKKSHKCPDKEINFFLYTPENIRTWVSALNPESLESLGWRLDRKNVFIIHGFNGTESKNPMTFLRDAFLHREDYNVFMVDWAPLTRIPCYLSALNNMKLVAQCTAQLYTRLTDEGALAKATTCVGHSLGAHICGMVSNHLTEKQHKIVGLDPAKPLVSIYGSKQFRLTRDDAHIVHVLHTNAGFLGEVGQVGHADFCINGGTNQPGCKGHLIRRARCSHFQSCCYFAAAVRRRMTLVGVPCSQECPKKTSFWGFLNQKNALSLGEETPDRASGMYCVRIDIDEDCPFD